MDKDQLIKFLHEGQNSNIILPQDTGEPIFFFFLGHINFATLPKKEVVKKLVALAEKFELKEELINLAAHPNDIHRLKKPWWIPRVTRWQGPNMSRSYDIPLREWINEA